LIALGTLAGVRSFVVVRDYAPEEMLVYQDLVAMSLRRNEMLIPDRYLRTDDLDALRANWVEGQIGSIVYQADGPVRFEPYTRGHVDALQSEWVRSALRHPSDYAVVRAKFALQLVGLRAGMVGAWFDRSDTLRWRGSTELRQRVTAMADVRASYLDAFDGDTPGSPGPLHQPWLYLMFGIVGAILFVAIGGTARVFGWAVLALQVLLQLVLAIAAPVVEFRFQYFQVMLGIVLLVVGVQLWAVHRRGHQIWPQVPDESGMVGAPSLVQSSSTWALRIQVTEQSRVHIHTRVYWTLSRQMEFRLAPAPASV